MAESPRNKGQYLQGATPHIVPKISGSFLSVDGMVFFDTNYEQVDFPHLYSIIGNTYDDGTTGGTEFKTPTLSEWGLPELKTESFKPTLVIDMYDNTKYKGAKLEGVIYDGVNREMITIKITDDGTNTGIDVSQIGVNDEYFSILDFVPSINGNTVQITVTVGDTVTFEYTVTPLPVSSDHRYMIRF